MGENIQVARTTPATSWRFPAMRRRGRWPELGRARDRPRSPRRHGPMSINTGESRSTSSRGLRRIELISNSLSRPTGNKISSNDRDHCSLHLPGANATGDKHAGARPWCCCSLAYERGGQLHPGASRQQIMGHLCLRGVYLCPMAAASLDAKPSTLLGPSRGHWGGETRTTAGITMTMKSFPPLHRPVVGVRPEWISRRTRPLPRGWT